MNNHILNQLENIKSETESYQKLIDDELWDELNELSVKRQASLEKIFAMPIDDTAKESVQILIQQILDLDSRYREMILNNKKTMTSNVIDIKSKLKAANKYRIVNALP